VSGVGDVETGRAGRPRRAQTFATMALLVVVATAVALVLAQSAGALHLSFLGPVG
jgi:hypothetical protein